MVSDCHNRVYDCQKAFLNHHHDCQYLDDVTTTFANFNSFISSSERIFAILWNKQIYNKNITQATKNMELNGNNLTF